MLSKMPQQAIGFLRLSISLAIITAIAPASAESGNNLSELGQLDVVPASEPILANNPSGVEFIKPKSSELSQPAPQLQNSSGVEFRKSKAMVNPSDPHAQALQKLNERYNCGISPITNPTSHIEFSKQVSTCLTAMEIKMAQEPGVVSSNEDLDSLKELVSAYRDEINSLANDLSLTNDRITESTFSTTTKLVGEVIFGLNTFGGGTPTATANSSNTTFTDRVRLNFDTSFTGKDRLRTRLQARNFTNFNRAVTGTNLTRLGFDGNDGDNAAFVGYLQYRTPLSDQSTLFVDAVGARFNENFYTFHPQLTSSGGGAISRFGRYNPIFRLSGDGTGATVDYKFSKEFSATVGYAAPGFPASTAANPAVNNGLFNGSNAFLGSLRYQASSGVDFGLAYARSYHSGGSGLVGGTGTQFADNPFSGARTSANHYSFLASARLFPGLVVSGWAGFANATNESASGSADIFNFAVSAALPDLGAKGNTLGFIFGAPPRVTSSSVAARVDSQTPLHFETLYKIKYNDYIDITPGILLITNPDTANRETEYVGTIRTTFRF